MKWLQPVIIQLVVLNGLFFGVALSRQVNTGDIVEGYKIVERIDFLGYNKQHHLDENNYRLWAQSEDKLPCLQCEKFSPNAVSVPLAQIKTAHAAETTRGTLGDNAISIDDSSIVASGIKLLLNSR
jgi:hypothetical protein